MAPSESDEKSGTVTHVFTNQDSVWFSGHFPGNPILPGVALLGFVQEAIRQYEQLRGRSLTVNGLRRVKFKRLVRPNEHLTITLSPPGEAEPIAFAFQIKVKEEICCSGHFLVSGGPGERVRD